jgi:hypothetical protein
LNARSGLASHESIVNAVNHQNIDGSFLLTLRHTEDFILTNLAQIQFEDIQDANVITLFQLACSQKFNQVLAKVLANYKDNFDLMLSQHERDGNNALMEAAISKSEEILFSLIGFVSISDQTDTYLGKVLHQKNDKEQTVLKIITSHGQDLQFYQVTKYLFSV